MKRVLTVQDISCVGKCSLGVALPIISAAGAEAAVLPTAVLSAHTAFAHVYKQSLLLGSRKDLRSILYIQDISLPRSRSALCPGF